MAHVLGYICFIHVKVVYDVCDIAMMYNVCERKIKGVMSPNMRLFSLTMTLLFDSSVCKNIKPSAIHTITQHWNPFETGIS